MYVNAFNRDIQRIIEIEKETKKRIDWDHYFIKIALAATSRATCLRRRYGAIIVDPENHNIISTGYCGNPSGVQNCFNIGKCFRDEAGIPPLMLYDLCGSVHGEQNAIMLAGKERCKGKIMYVAGMDYQKETICSGRPCSTKCEPMIINSGLDKVIFLDEKFEITTLLVSEMKNERNKDPHKKSREQLRLLKERGFKTLK